MKKYAIIVAGGTGSRMNSDIPKQFLELNGLPILMHTIDAFHNYDDSIHITVVLPSTHLEMWDQLTQKHQFGKKQQVVTGGESRYESVANGLDTIQTEGLVAIHDGARPLVDASTIKRTFDTANIYGSGVAAVPLKDSIRVTDGDTNKSVNRSLYMMIQTPQTFDLNAIKAAYNQTKSISQTFTDDASVLEANHGSIRLVEGSYDNIKVTTPEDMILAEMFLSKRITGTK